MSAILTGVGKFFLQLRFNLSTFLMFPPTQTAQILDFIKQTPTGKLKTFFFYQLNNKSNKRWEEKVNNKIHVSETCKHDHMELNKTIDFLSLLCDSETRKAKSTSPTCQP